MPRAARLPLLVTCLCAVAPISAPAGAQLTALGAFVLDACDAPADCHTDEFFGKALAVGDFDGDSFDDLAVGVDESVDGAPAAGEVHVFYGSPGGLTLTGAQLFNATTPGVPGIPEAGDRFGFALGAADFDGDDFEDLAIGVPFENIGTVAEAGAVIVLFGSEAGLVTAGALSLNQNVLPSGSAETAEEDDLFGFSLAASLRELAVGVPGETFIPVLEAKAGRIHVFETPNPATPLARVDDYEQNDFLSDCGATDGNEAFDSWGSQIARLRLGVNDVYAIASSFEGFSGISLAGRVTQGFAQFSACFDQNTPSVAETAEEGDMFGSALASGDFDNDGSDDLAIGAPFEAYDDTPGVRRGGVNVLFSDSSGLTTVGDRFFSQLDFPAFPGFGRAVEQFGQALATGDFDNDLRDDLAIGAPFEEVGGAQDAGTIHVAYGDPSGFDENRNQTFHSDFPSGMPDAPNTNDRFGAALASGDFDGSGTDDLAIGMPREDVAGIDGAGAITVLYGLDRETGAFGTVHLSPSFSVQESNQLVTVSITREGGAVLAASVDHARTGGSATPGTDFTYTAGSESWPAGDIGVEIFAVGILGDTLDEGNETITFTLSDPSAGLAIEAPSAITITIQDNDEGGVLSFAQPVTVFSELAGAVQVAVTRTLGAASGVTVQYTTSNATATAGLDYTATSGTLTFGANETTKFIPLQILDDSTAEGGEVFLVTLSNPGGGGVLGTFIVHQVVINDNDVAGGIEFEDLLSVVAETAGTTLVEVVRTGGAASGVTVAFATEDDTAIAGSDYVATSGILTWGAGETVQTIEVELIDDGESEGHETLRIQLSSPGGGAVLGSNITHQLVILGNAIFVDGFETGNTSAWDAIAP